MAGAGYIIEIVFGALGLIPTERNAQVIEAHISWNYTTWLNIAFLLLAVALILRFVRTGGGMMLKMMGGTPEQPGAENGHAHHGMHGAHQVPAEEHPPVPGGPAVGGDQGQAHPGP